MILKEYGFHRYDLIGALDDAYSRIKAQAPNKKIKIISWSYQMLKRGRMFVEIVADIE